MKKAYFFCIILFLALSLMFWHIYQKEKTTLYIDIVTVETIYKPARHHKTCLGRGLLGEVNERFIVVLKFQHDRRVIESEEIYNKMKSWNGKTVILYWMEHPFRVISIK